MSKRRHDESGTTPYDKMRKLNDYNEILQVIESYISNFLSIIKKYRENISKLDYINGIINDKNYLLYMPYITSIYEDIFRNSPLSTTPYKQLITYLIEIIQAEIKVLNELISYLQKVSTYIFDHYLDNVPIENIEPIISSDIPTSRKLELLKKEYPEISRKYLLLQNEQIRYKYLKYKQKYLILQNKLKISNN